MKAHFSFHGAPTRALGVACTLALLPLSSLFASSAEMVRTLVFAGSDEAFVRVSWSFSEKPDSAVIVRERTRSGWTLLFDAASNPAVEAVQSAEGGTAFLIGREALATEGSFSYRLRSEPVSAKRLFAAAAPVSFVSGTFSLSSGNGLTTGEVAEGEVSSIPTAVALPADASGKAVPGEDQFRITSFLVVPGESPRVTFSWAGAGSAPVLVQYRASLDPVPASKGGLSTQSEDGWRTVAVLRPEAAGGKSAMEDTEYTASPDMDAPEGFYRLVVTEE